MKGQVLLQVSLKDLSWSFFSNYLSDIDADIMTSVVTSFADDTSFKGDKINR